MNRFQPTYCQTENIIILKKKDSFLRIRWLVGLVKLCNTSVYTYQIYMWSAQKRFCLVRLMKIFKFIGYYRVL